jgi:GTP-binding protein HflX
LHVVDASHPRRAQQIEDVNAVLAEIGASAIPQIVVYNKIDLVPALPVPDPGVGRDEYGKINHLRVSALNGLGMEQVRAAVGEFVDARRRESSPQLQVCESMESTPAAPFGAAL